jgi:hypothetical protein
VNIGEGVMSLRRAFRIAGAQTVLASHWKVSDKATSQLMTEFIRRWRSSEPRAKAWPFCSPLQEPKTARSTFAQNPGKLEICCFFSDAGKRARRPALLQSPLLPCGRRARRSRQRTRRPLNTGSTEASQS